MVVTFSAASSRLTSRWGQRHGAVEAFMEIAKGRFWSTRSTPEVREGMNASRRRRRAGAKFPLGRLPLAHSTETFKVHGTETHVQVRLDGVSWPDPRPTSRCSEPFRSALPTRPPAAGLMKGGLDYRASSGEP